MKQSTARRDGQPRSLDDGPGEHHDWFYGDAVEQRGDGGAVLDIGVIANPSANETSMAHDDGALFIDWENQGRQWTDWRLVCPRY